MVFCVTLGNFLLLSMPGCLLHIVLVSTRVLCDLSCSALDDFYAAWRMSIRRIWNLPWQAHLLPLLSACLPVHHELCLRVMCFAHHNTLVIALYDVMYGRFSSPVGRNMLRCAQRYLCSVEDLLCRSSYVVLLNCVFVSVCLTRSLLVT